MPRRLGNLAERVKSVKPQDSEGFLGVGQAQDLITEIPVAKVEGAPWNARKYFDDAKLQALASSLRVNGLLQPVLVRPMGDVFQLIVGERRYRAAKIAGLKTLRAHVRDLTDKGARHLSLTENLDREDLSSYEEATGIMDLLILEVGEEPAFLDYRNEGESAEGAVTRLLFKLQNDVLAASKLRQQPQEEKAANGHMPINIPTSNGHVPINVEPPFDTLYEQILEVFSRHAKITWNTYIRNRLPLLNMPSDLRQALTEGQIDQSKARELARISDGKTRKVLLKETIRGALTSEEVKARVRDRLNLPATHNEFSADFRVITRQLKASPHLPDDKRARVRELMAELRELLEPKPKTRNRRAPLSQERDG